MASGSQQIIIDNRSSDFVSFTGPWDHQGVFTEFNATSSFPLRPGANVTLEFNGTAVALYGTWGSGGNSTSLEFSIDNNLIQSGRVGTVDNQGRVSHYSFLEADVPDGAHTLTTSVTSIGGDPEQGDNANWFLDYFIVTQSAGTKVEEGAMWFFDDTDPAFQYSGSWSSDGGTSEDMNTTVHGALSMNSSVSLNFTGTFVNVYGRIPLSSSVVNIAQFVVDGGTPAVAKYPPVQNVSFGQFNTSPNLRLYHNASLSPGPHIMVITPLDKDILWIDYATSGNGVDTTNIGDHVDNVLSPSIAPITPTPSAVSSHTSLPNSSSHANAAGKIAGGVVGALAGLALLALVIIFCMRRRRKQTKVMEQTRPHQLPLPSHLREAPLAESLNPVRASNDPRRVVPFDFKYDSLSPSSFGDPGSARTLSDYERGKGIASTSRTMSPSNSTITTSITASYPSSTLVTPGTSSSALAPPTVQHHDSGIRGLIVPETVEEAPPLYSED